MNDVMKHAVAHRTRADYSGEVVWIIGASSGIGLALAQELSQRGARLLLSARRAHALEALITQLGSEATALPCDVTDAEAVRLSALAAKARWGRLDRVIFMAAGYKPMMLAALDLQATRQMMEANLLGAFNVIHACLPLLRERANGQLRPQLALCASVAGYTGLPGGQPYSATKAGLINLAESLHAEHGDQLDIKVINPGFVRTDLTAQNDFDMPMILTPEQAARAIANGLRRRGFEIHFPARFSGSLKLLRVLPYRLRLALTARLRRPH